jgi:hypothetical protein
MKPYLLAGAVMMLSAFSAQAASQNRPYDWSYWTNRETTDQRGEYHEGHNDKPGHWDNGLHKGPRDHWDNDDRDRDRQGDHRDKKHHSGKRDHDHHEGRNQDHHEGRKD